MIRSIQILAALAALCVLLLTGCQGNSYSCKGGTCHVTVTGAGQTVEVSDTDITVSEISDQRMTVSVGGSAPTTISVGQSEHVGPVTIKVTSVQDDKVKFDLR